MPKDGDRPRARSNLRPIPTQTLLLEAALLPAPEAAARWAEWWSRTNLDEIDSGSARLLPLVYANVRSVVRTALSARIRGTYRHAWVANQTLLGAAPEVLEGLRRASLSALLLGGVPLVLAYYRDHGARRIDGLEVAVPREELARAEAVLVGLGWTPVGPRPDPDRPGPSVHAFGHASGRVVKLYGHILPGYPWPELDARLRRRALPLALPGGTATVLAAGDLLLRVLVCDTAWKPASSLVWMADAAVILRSSATIIDWEGLAEEARQLGAGWTAWRGLEYLATLRFAELPTSARRAFQDFRPTTEERIEQWCTGRRSPGLLLGGVAQQWCQYRRSVRHAGQRPRTMGFARTLARAWGVEHVRSLPGAVVKRLARQMARAVRPPGGD